MRYVVRARAAMAEGDLDSAIDELQAASDIQSVIQHTEPPFCYHPVLQTLGAALLLDGQPERAEPEFVAMLVENPDAALAYWGLGEARRARGDQTGAEAARVLFGRGWLGAKESQLKQL